MKMPTDLEQAFSQQITMELGSGNAYLQVAAYLTDQNFAGMSSWMRAQANEERSHADRFLDFVLDRGGKAIIGSVDAPKADFDSPLEAFETAVAQRGGGDFGDP